MSHYKNPNSNGAFGSVTSVPPRLIADILLTISFSLYCSALIIYTLPSASPFKTPLTQFKSAVWHTSSFIYPLHNTGMYQSETLTIREVKETVQLISSCQTSFGSLAVHWHPVGPFFAISQCGDQVSPNAGDL